VAKTPKRPQSSSSEKPSGTSSSRSKDSASEYLASTQPRGRVPLISVIDIEPQTFDACRKWLIARENGTSNISFKQFYEEFLQPVLKTKYSRRHLHDFVRQHDVR